MLVADASGYTATCGQSNNVIVSFTSLAFVQDGAPDLFLHLDVNADWEVRSRTLTRDLDPIRLTLDFP